MTPRLTVDLWPHPLTDEGRIGREIGLPADPTVEGVVRRLFPALRHVEHVSAALDGEPVPAHAWSAARLRGGEVLTLRRICRGGGGDSDARQAILTIAVLAAAYAGAGPLAGALSISSSAAFTTIMVGGGLIVQTLASPSTPAFRGRPEPSAAATGRGFAPASSANRTRPHGPMLLVLGRHRVYPDRVSDVEYRRDSSGEMDVRQYLSWGVGDLAIGDLLIGSAALSTYRNTSATTFLPGTTPWGPTDRLVRVQGVDLTIEGTARVTRAAHPDAVGVVFLVQTRLGYTDDAGAARSRSVTIEAAAGGSTVTRTFSGDDYSIEQYEIEIVFSSPSASREVSLRRRTEAAGDARAADDVRWVTLRSLLPVPSSLDRSADTLTRVDVRVTDQVGSRLDPIHAVVEQRVPVWDGSAWTAARQPSTNPAALYRAVALGWRAADGTLLAGAGLTAAEVDDAALGAWYDWCAAHEPVLHCSLVVDRDMDCQRLLEHVARCGRASPTWQTGKLGVVWERTRAATAAVTPERIVAGTMNAVWAADPVADEVIAKYVDPEHDWTVREVRRRAPGATGSAARTVTIDATGVTNAAQASYLAGLQAAHQEIHRRRLTWEMDRSALALARGDVVRLSHALVTGGTSGRARSVRARAVALDRDVDVPAGSTLLVAGPDRTTAQAAIASAEGSPPVLVLAAPLPAALVEADPDDVAWRLYPAGEDPLAVRIVSVEPVSRDRVRLSAIDESSRYTAIPEATEEIISITTSGTHRWAGPGTAALVWLVSGRGGRGGLGGRAGRQGAGVDRSLQRVGDGPGGLGGGGGQGGLHAAGGRAGSGGAGRAGGGGGSGYTEGPSYGRSHEPERIYWAAGGNGGGGGGGGAGGAGGATVLTVGDDTWTTGEGLGGAGRDGETSFSPSGRNRGIGGRGGFSPGRTTRDHDRAGALSIEVVALTGLSPGDELVFVLGAGGGHGTHGGAGGAGGAVGTSHHNRGIVPTPVTTIAQAGYARILPT